MTTLPREWAKWSGPQAPSKFDGILWYLAVIQIAVHVAIHEFSLFLYTHCSPCGHCRFSCKYSYQLQLSTSIAAHVVIQNVHVLIPSLSHLATWESRDDIYTYCGICGHTPTRVCHMGLTMWAVWMQWYNMEFNCHTYCSPCGHVQDAQVNINTHCDPCGHLIVLCDHTPRRVVQMGSTTWAAQMRWYGIWLPHIIQPMWFYRSLLSPYIHIAARMVIAFPCICLCHLVVTQDVHANINAHCSPCGHLRVLWKYLYLLWPVWPHSRDSGPHGPPKCDCTIWYLAVTQCGSYGHTGVCSLPLYTLQPIWSSRIGWPHGPQ